MHERPRVVGSAQESAARIVLLSGKRHLTVKGTEHQCLEVRLRCHTMPFYDLYLLDRFSYFVRQLVDRFQFFIII